MKNQDLDQNDIESMLNDLGIKLRADLIYVMEEIARQKFYVSYGMCRLGGSFTKALGEALICADYPNTFKIKQMWPEYWEEYLEIGKEMYKDMKEIYKDMNIKKAE